MTDTAIEVNFLSTFFVREIDTVPVFPNNAAICFEGNGTLSGMSPYNLTLNGQPVAGTVQVYNQKSFMTNKPVLVREVETNEFGDWSVSNINETSEYFLVAKISGKNYQIIQGVTPHV